MKSERRAVWFLTLLIPGVAFAAEEPRALPKPLPDHPGNIFVVGEQVIVAVPPLKEEKAGTWQLVDYEGGNVAQGSATNGKAILGKLSAGYYELKRLGKDLADKRPTTIGVLPLLQSPTSRISPIGVDLSMAWLCSEAQHEGVIGLCTLAGINWVRDRLSWQELEPKKGEFVPATKYDDVVRKLARSGLRVLEVHCDSPSWASENPKRQPTDLRDAYRFMEAMARRWRGEVLAFEPWNEGDIEVFGGHTGAEIAALQKASYLGLKAGNSNVIACQNVFTSPNPNILADFNSNQPWPYFDTFNLHHYVSLDGYPAVYAAYRAVSAGKPMWVSEFNVSVGWTGDRDEQEPTSQDLRLQAERVAQSFASALHEGPAICFYFILPHYGEAQTQHGLLHRDLTPRPGYLALAAVGRLLADAKPLGRMRVENNVRAYAFRARPDGQERDVIVAWTSGGEAALKLPVAPVAVFDHLGRSRSNSASSLQLSTAPVFAVCSKDALSTAPLQPPPAKPQFKPGKPSSVVLQAALPKEKVAAVLSAYLCSSARPDSIPVFAYNFSSQRAAGKLSATAPAEWKLSLPETVELAPGERKELSLTVDCREGITTPADTVRINGDFGSAGQTVLSLRLAPQPFTILKAPGLPIVGAHDPNRWQYLSPSGSELKMSKTDGGITFDAQLRGGDHFVYPLLILADGERPPAGCLALAATLTAVAEKANFRVIFEEENQSAYFSDFYPQPASGETVEAVALLSTAIFGEGWSKPDDNQRLDADKIRTIRVGCNPEGDKMTYTIKNVRWVKPGRSARN